MKKQTQRSTNPYPYSDSNKRYQTYDYYTRHTFGGKCARVPLDAGFTCPNKDGTCGRGGCIFCFGGSAAAAPGTLREQYDRAVETALRKWEPVGYIPYLQANSNTYAPAETLRRVYAEAAALPDSVMLCIATRADCLGEDVLEEIARISETIPVTVELGLQSSSDETARRICRGYGFDVFLSGYERLRTLGDRVGVGIHIINGLPGERYEDMLATARDVAALHPNQLKIHLLNVLRGTVLAEMYVAGRYVPMERDEYVATVCDQLELMPPDVVIARVTGDSEAEHLLAPMWARRKTEVSNMIDKELFARSSWQGKRYIGTNEEIKQYGSEKELKPD